MYPLTAETVLKSTYMDDSIDSVETVPKWHSVVNSCSTVGQEPVAKTFDMYRNSTEDTFTISAAELPMTKRNVLREAATVFDLPGSVGTAFNACTWNTHTICYILSRHHGCTIVNSGPGLLSSLCGLSCQGDSKW